MQSGDSSQTWTPEPPCDTTCQQGTWALSTPLRWPGLISMVSLGTLPRCRLHNERETKLQAQGQCLKSKGSIIPQEVVVGVQRPPPVRNKLAGFQRGHQHSGGNWRCPAGLGTAACGSSGQESSWPWPGLVSSSREQVGAQD